jgi:hypothetical protein
VLEGGLMRVSLAAIIIAGLLDGAYSLTVSPPARFAL